MVGQTISHYRITEKLGEGGMGVVYKAEDTSLDRHVALKFLAAHLVSDEDVRKRFEREAKAAASLNHPNICTVYEIAEANGRTFITMAFLEGEGLDKRIEAGPLKLKDVLDIAIQTAQGLQAAHAKGIVHRDIKPANLMVTGSGSKQHVTIMDFGLAQLADRSKLTRTNETMGTVTYMSPEQTYGMELDHRTDIWSLGVVIYEMVTGQQPFKGHYDKAVMYSITNEEPGPMTALRTGVPMELEWLTDKCLAKDIEERYQHTDDLLVDLQGLRKKLESGKSTIMSAGPAASVVTGTHAGLKQGQAESPSLLGPLTRYRVIGNLEEQGDVATYRAEDTQLRRSVAIRVVPESASRKLEQRQRLLRIGFLTTAVLLIVALGLLGLTRLDRPSATEAIPLRKFSFAPPAALNRRSGIAQVAVSPNGRHVAFVAGATATLWIRDLANEQVREFQGTENARFPFWSPDSEFIGFGAGEELKKISVEGTAAISLCELPHRNWFFGGAWSPHGDSIVFSSEYPLKLYEVPARGGTARLLFEPEGSEKGPHAVVPHFLPVEAAARSLLFAKGSPNDTEIVLKNLETGEHLSLGAGVSPWYSSTGHIVYQTNSGEGGLWALPFSIETLKPAGEAFPIAQNVGFPSIASDGTLVSADFRAGRRQLIWVDREGRKLGEIGQPQLYIGYPDLSPDERRVAAPGVEGGAQDIWIHDVDRPVKTRFTFDPANDSFAAWTPSGRDINFTSERNGNPDIFTKAADGSGEAEVLVGTPVREDTPDWSLDERYLIYNTRLPETQRDLAYRERQQDGSLGEPVIFLQTKFEEAAPKFSPNGRFVVYTSDESGRFEVYVRSFPDGTGKRQISSAGGNQPRWSHDGKEIFYVDRDTLMAVPVTTTPGFSVDSPDLLFAHPGLVNAAGVSPIYDVANDGQRFVVRETLEDGEPTSIHVVQNWYAEFKGRERD